LAAAFPVIFFVTEIYGSGIAVVSIKFYITLSYGFSAVNEFSLTLQSDKKTFMISE
jgi:hypothetical protein